VGNGLRKRLRCNGRKKKKNTKKRIEKRWTTRTIFVFGVVCGNDRLNVRNNNNKNKNKTIRVRRYRPFRFPRWFVHPPARAADDAPSAPTGRVVASHVSARWQHEKRVPPSRSGSTRKGIKKSTRVRSRRKRTELTTGKSVFRKGNRDVHVRCEKKFYPKRTRDVQPLLRCLTYTFSNTFPEISRVLFERSRMTKNILNRART
jgi:hypothetical protein